MHIVTARNFRKGMDSENTLQYSKKLMIILIHLLNDIVKSFTIAYAADLDSKVTLCN